jgi:23S rRNA G2445 N2-methylase RlmL
MSKEGPRIFANDRELSCVEMSIASAGSLKIHRMIDFSCKDAAFYRPKKVPEVVVTNPPWDRRIQGAEEAWSALGEFGREVVSRNQGGSTSTSTSRSLWALTGNSYMTQYTNLSVQQTVDFNAASVDMRFCSFKV